MTKEQEVILGVIKAQFEVLGKKVGHEPSFDDLTGDGWFIQTPDGYAARFEHYKGECYCLGVEPSCTADKWDSTSFSILCETESLDTISKILQAAIHCF